MNSLASTPQPMCPHGFSGRAFGMFMNLFNRDAHKLACKRLNVGTSDAILEIGFGTGQFIQMLACAATKGFVAGVDPSELMLKTARRRNAQYIERGIVDLRLGTVSSLPWQNAHFNKAAALHSFQFWSNPAQDLEEVARVLKPGGLLLLVLRAHDRHRTSDWLPNPLSRASDEVGAILDTLPKHGFENARLERRVGTSHVIVAIRC